MIFPTAKKPGDEDKKPQVIKECYCPNGHNLINQQSVFNEFNGIVLKVTCAGKIGLLFLSPICGDKSRFTFDLDLIEGELLEIHCLECDTPLPVYGPCKCGGKFVTMFLDKEPDYTNCIGICTRVGCSHSWIKHGDDIRRCFMSEKL